MQNKNYSLVGFAMGDPDFTHFKNPLRNLVHSFVALCGTKKAVTKSISVISNLRKVKIIV